MLAKDNSARDETHRSNRWRSHLGFIVPFAMACVITLVLETYVEHRRSDYADNSGAPPALFDLNAVYQRIVASGPRRPEPHFTILLPLSDTDPGISNICQQRVFLAKLVTAVSKLNPSVIVIDKYFGASTCPNSDPGTAALKKTVHEVSRKIPIVVGRRVKEYSIQRGSIPALFPALDLASDRSVTEGLVNVDVDTRQAPLGFRIQVGPNKVDWQPSLSLQAAKAYDPKLLRKEEALQRMIDAERHPYISFLDPGILREIASYTTKDVICAATQKCATRIDLSYLRGRIVIMADDNRDLDYHESVVGRMAGYVLQANYIEALLDQRYFKPAGRTTNYLAGFVIYIVFHWILVKHHHAVQEATGWRVLPILLRYATWTSVMIAATLGVLYLIVMHAGLYVNPTTMGVVVIVFKSCELLFAMVPRNHEARSGR